MPAPTRNTPAVRSLRRTAWADLRADLRASLVVFLVAVPLSLGIALASGAPIMAGLIAAVVGGVVAGLLGSSPLQVSGPAAGLTVVLAELITRFGWQVTAMITFGAGLVQVLFGLTRLARFAAAIPPAVVHGMLAGIGITIALGQLHVVLGGSPQPDPVTNALQLPAQLLGSHDHAAMVGLVAIAVIALWPRLPRPIRVVPGPLVAVAVATGLALLWPDVPRVALPGGLLDAITLPQLALLPGDEWAGLAGGVLTVALIASVESLLSAVAVDRMHEGPRTDVDRELLGQGAGNVVSGLLGGLPITGVIVRSSANAEAGARTRASAVLHGVWIAVFGIALVDVIQAIPLAALAGLLVVVGIGLVKPVDLRTARVHGELPIYLATAAGVLLLNLLEGVAIGIAVAGVLMLHRAVRARIRIAPPDRDGDAHHVVVEGTLSFLSVPALSRALSRVPTGAAAQVDLVVDYLDHAAYDHLDAWTRRHRATGGSVEVTEPGEQGRTGRSRSPFRFASWSQWQAGEMATDPTGTVLAGVAAYHARTAGLIRPRMRELVGGQRPSALLLTCADSRVVPNVITHSGPGDLFTVQNVGNFVTGEASQAALQYATDVLKVPLAIVCGHSGCGAMRALLDPPAVEQPPRALASWLAAGLPGLAAFRDGHPVGRAALAAGADEVDALAMVNVALQLQELRSPDRGLAALGLFFDIRSARVLVLDGDAQAFRPLDAQAGATKMQNGCPAGSA
ncbi:SulP family inorganic anion transporter [Pseudonocardia sp. GCM10023141]|uniref:SulP family inorganic anion transporter n=1 Tax=Pseudonocardia sp. GCM10023141 TaxID=3252653 RepID=UPI003615D061